jgi:hypothetical protein
MQIYITRIAKINVEKKKKLRTPEMLRIVKDTEQLQFLYIADRISKCITTLGNSLTFSNSFL